ncbi:MAG: TIGR03960 family B12-binding radical SAM protein [Dehalococcoidia bacterium]|nr:MAG: TIGR03960 family B12-binding radical SAM protein [Dehalococcoidia bacterium]
MDPILRRVSKPARYSGGEWNSVVKDWSHTPLRVALAYPDVYDIGMSNLGLAILYELLNQDDSVLCERAYAPWTDMEQAIRQEGIPLFSLETRHPLGEFDVIGFSLGYELTYTNVLNMLDLAGLPLAAADRRRALPLVIAGGSGALNPEPLADFIDAFALGDGEELILDIVDCVRCFKERRGRSKRRLLRELAAIKGIYVPRFCEVIYHPDGTIAEVRSVDVAASPRPRKRFVQKLLALPKRPIVPFVQIVHDRAGIEIQRGCTQGCRFCQAGMIYRPRLERTAQEAVALAREVLASTGYRELSLLSLSTTDHSQIVPMMRALKEEFGDSVVISLPSLRVDSFSVEVAEAVSGPGKHTITFAPEAGSQRLRVAINKPMTEEDVLRAAEAAFSRGWTSIKLYFMVGLPTETLEDMQEIVDLAARVKEIGRRYHRGRARVRVSTSIFVAKPHSPFQWAHQSTAEELGPKHDLLRRGCKRAGVEFSWEEPEHSLLEAVISRGDRRLGQAIQRAWEVGCKFDAWREHLDWGRWQQAFQECDLDPSFYAHRERGLFEKFPWSHIDVGVSEAYLRGEWLKTAKGAATVDCHRELCSVCGVQRLEAESCLAKIDELIRRRRSRRAHDPGERMQVS